MGAFSEGWGGRRDGRGVEEALGFGEVVINGFEGGAEGTGGVGVRVAMPDGRWCRCRSKREGSVDPLIRGEAAMNGAREVSLANPDSPRGRP